jgi:hypothetical protein
LRSDRDALHAVADWIKTFAVRPHEDLGRAGPVCPFVPGALERKTLLLALGQIADRGAPRVVELVNGYKSLFLDAEPTDGDDAYYKVIVVVFTDLSADRTQGVFDAVLQQLAVPSYVEDGTVVGPFYKGIEGTRATASGVVPQQEHGLRILRYRCGIPPRPALWGTRGSERREPPWSTTRAATTGDPARRPSLGRRVGRG